MKTKANRKWKTIKTKTKTKEIIKRTAIKKLSSNTDTGKVVGEKKQRQRETKTGRTKDRQNVCSLTRKRSLKCTKSENIKLQM